MQSVEHYASLAVMFLPSEHAKLTMAKVNIFC